MVSVGEGETYIITKSGGKYKKRIHIHITRII